MMQILVRTILEKTIVLEVESSDTIVDVKKKIYDHDGTLPERHMLMYAGKELENDHRTLSDYGICDYSELRVLRRLHLPMQIVIETVNGWATITTLDDVEVTDTVRSVKARIRDKVGIRVDQQTLYFEHILLEDRRMLAEYSIVRNHDALELAID